MSTPPVHTMFTDVPAQPERVQGVVRKKGKKAESHDSVAQGEPSEVMTAQAAAGYLQVTVDAVISEAVAGRLPGRLIAGEWRFSRSGLLAWLGGAAPTTPSDRDRLLAMAGCWAGDQTAEALVADVYRRRAETRSTTQAG